MTMDRGSNRADPFSKVLYRIQEAKNKIDSLNSLPGPCVFISHKKEDTEASEVIAKYLMASGIDVYFDKYDKTLSELAKEGDPNKVTERIQEGIEYSTHMLCVVSPETISSYWVPFEVGYGYKQLKLGVLTLKGLKDETLPDYMKTTDVVRGTRSLNDFIGRLLNKSVDTLQASGVIQKHTNIEHPLDAFLDWRL